MLAIQRLQRYLQANPNSKQAPGLAHLVRCLTENRVYPLQQLYQLDYEAFELALELMNDWRLDRHYATDLKLIEAAANVATAEAA